MGQNGAFEYFVSGALAISLPEKSLWKSGTGIYQNAKDAGPQIFLAGIAPSLEAVNGQPRVTNLDLSFFALAGREDTIEVKYIDAALARKTYNCTVNVL